jgi:hypothetical protein
MTRRKPLIRETNPHPLIGSDGPSTHEASESDLHRVCLARLRDAYRFSQPRGVSFLPKPFRFCFTPVTPMGFSLQRFAPPTQPPMPSGLAAPPGVIRTVEPQTMDNAAVDGRPPATTQPPYATRSRDVPAPVHLGSGCDRVQGGSQRPGSARRPCALSCALRGIPDGGTEVPTSAMPAHPSTGFPFRPGEAAAAWLVPMRSTFATSGHPCTKREHRPLRLRSAGAGHPSDCTVGPGESKIRRFRGLQKGPPSVTGRTRRDSELPCRNVPWGPGRTHLQGFEPCRSSYIHPSGVT